ncbi:hypothetical protein V7S43_006764 [Phytophthora oleae]|uniref:WW domain-containing protein n=1 Tax=Phytophthora oleae TaxID=2107226 RepID=A0ABD3FMA9_9STRA
MTEPSTNDFMPQWQYDHSQDRDFVQDEAVIHWRGMNRVAEQVRQREERYLEGDFDAMDFEARAAALEAHFFGVKIRPPPSDRAVPRVRPQSASLYRRVADSDVSIAANFEIRRRQRPQSAKNRSDIPKASEGVDWNTPTESKASKWREMLARGPDFKQLTLRQLELETYELLYNTLEQRQGIDVQPSARRRKRKKKASNAISSDSKELACGSGLHLARSRKKRQQERDRELMLGKTRQPSRRSERERAKAETKEKQAIQDKTRRRGKQLKEKTSREQLQDYQPVQVSTQDKRTGEVYVQRPSSANRVRGPWIPSGSATSIAIRGISSASEVQVTQDKRVEQMLEEFQSHAHAHLKNVQNRLKMAQQRVGESRTAKYMNNSGRPASAPRIATRCTDESKGVSLQSLKGNQENDRIRAANFRESILSAPVLTELQLSSCEIDALISESPATPRLVIPPLKFPTNLGKYQLTNDSQDGMPELPEQSSCLLPSNSIGADDDISQVKTTCGEKIEGESTLLCDITTNMKHVDEMETQSETPAHDQDRRTTIEDLYLAEGQDEQTSSGFSSGGNETIPGELELESQTLRGVLIEDANCMDLKLLDPDTPSPKGVGSAQNTTLLSEEGILTESSTNPTDSLLQEATDTAKYNSVEIFVEASDLSSRERGFPIVTLVETAESDISCPEQQSADYNVCGEHSSNVSMADKQVDGIGAGIIMDEDLLQQSENDDLPLLGHSDSTEYERNGSVFQERKNDREVTKLTSLKLMPSTQMEAELEQPSSVVPISPELELTSNYPESITSALKSDDHSETQVHVSPDDVLDVDRNDFRTIEDSGLPQSTITLATETDTLNSNSEDSGVGETGRFRTGEAAKTIDMDDNIADTLQPGNTYRYRTSDDNGEQQQEEHENVELPQQMSLEHIARVCTPPVHKNALAPESMFEQIPTLAKATALTPVTHEDKVEDPLRLHQQEMTRSFLKRISSRTCTVVDPELSTSQPEPRKEQGEDEDNLGFTERTGVVMGVESQVEQNVKPVKEREHIHGDCVIECEHAQALEDRDSTVEKYPPATVNPAATAPTEKVDAAESFTSAAGDSTVTDREHIAPPSTNSEAPWQQEPDPNDLTGCNQETLSHLTSTVATKVVDQDPTQPSVEHYNAARNIQAQYRCFVRRRLILDQLHFMVANERRQARRKSRQKERKTKPVDILTPMPVANSMDSLPEEVQEVALTTRSDKSVEVAPEPPLIKTPRPSVEDAGLGGRKNSHDYAFDLIDGSNEASGEVKLVVSARAVEGSVEVLRANGTRPEKLEQQQEHHTISSEKDVDNTTTSFGLLQGEQTNALLPSIAIDVKPSHEEPAASASFVASTTLAELAFTESVEENPPKFVNSTRVEAVPESAEVDPRWERYVDSTTSKSYYFNPSSNETQWTAPAGEDRSHSAIISSRATPTTPHSAAMTATDALNRQSELWQEFLDEASGQLYYYNTKTGECSWEPPANDSPGVVESLQSAPTAESKAIGASPWIMYIDPASQAPYYVNVETLTTSWEQPDDFVVAEPNANEETYVIAVDDHAALEI